MNHLSVPGAITPSSLTQTYVRAYNQWASAQPLVSELQRCCKGIRFQPVTDAL
ncbi:hypothetical protein JCM17042A_10110 [Ruminococcus champanellensis 18P13 = JCM 17042]